MVLRAGNILPFNDIRPFLPRPLFFRQERGGDAVLETAAYPMALSSMVESRAHFHVLDFGERSGFLDGGKPGSGIVIVANQDCGFAGDHVGDELEGLASDDGDGAEQGGFDDAMGPGACAGKAERELAFEQFADVGFVIEAGV